MCFYYCHEWNCGSGTFKVLWNVLSLVLHANDYSCQYTDILTDNQPNITVTIKAMVSGACSILLHLSYFLSYFYKYLSYFTNKLWPRVSKRYQQLQKKSTRNQNCWFTFQLETMLPFKQTNKKNQLVKTKRS